MTINAENKFSQLQETVKDNHKQLKNSNFNYNQVAHSSLNVGYLDGHKVTRLIVYLRGRGCEWTCQRYGGCFMCGHYFGTAMGEEIESGAFYTQFAQEFSKYDFQEIPIICIYNAGSILNPNEIPKSELLKIISLVNSNTYIKRIILESRPEFVTDEILTELSDICDGKIIEIGVGLETSNDQIRDTCINKGFTFDEYISSVNIIKKYRNIKALTYLTVKPILLTSSESIEDIISSIEDIIGYTDIISLEPVSIQENTLVSYLYKANLYSIPKGWMVKNIVEILERKMLLLKFELRLGGFEFFPIPEHVISNCELCNYELYKSIDIYNSTKDIKAIKELHCSCYQKYQLDLRKLPEYNDLEGRLENIMNLLSYNKLKVSQFDGL